jgi:two-component system, LuxR family, response regulator FixJ
MGQMLMQEIISQKVGECRVHSVPDRLVAVVDDDDAVRDSLRFLLEIAGYTVAAYASAAQFLKEAPLPELVCLVVDQHMPDVTGLQLVARLRGDGVGLPVALITGSPSADMLRLARELSVTTVMEKPLDDDQLLEFIATADD